MMSLLASFEAFGSTLTSILGIGAIIMLHELGHFLVAIWCGVTPRAFSIGFPPTFARRTYRGVEYRLGLTPFGGYVQFEGDSDDPKDAETGEPLPPAPGTLAAATYPRKVAIMLAGVAVNVLIAVVAFVAAFSRGVEVMSPVIGAVAPGSPAAAAGLLPDDRVRSIDGHPIYGFDDIQQETLFAEQVSVVVERAGVEQPPVLVDTRPSPQSGLRGIGISPRFSDDLLDVQPSTAAHAAGLRSGDRILGVAGVDVAAVDAALAAHAAAGPTDSVRWTVARGRDADEQRLDFALPGRTWLIGIRSDALRIEVIATGEAADAGLKSGDEPVSVGGVATPTALSFVLELTAAATETTGIVRRDGREVPFNAGPGLRTKAATMIGELRDNTIVVSPTRGATAVPGPAERAGLKPGSVIVAIDGKPIRDFAAIGAAAGSAGAAGRTLLMSWRDPDGTLREQVEVAPAAVQNAQSLGVQRAVSLEFVKADGVVDALGLGMDRTHRWVMRIMGTLRSLFSGDLGAQHLQGPIGIARAGSTTAKSGASAFLVFLGVISMNLAVLNLLPIPLLDGGQILMITITRLRGRPLPDAVAYWAALGSFVLLIGFMLFVTFNDIRNLL